MKTDAERARIIVGACEFPGAPCVFTGRHASLCTRCGILPDVADALASARREGRREGIEEAAKAVQEIGMRRLSEAAVGVRRSRGPRIGEIAARIRALATPAQEPPYG